MIGIVHSLVRSLLLLSAVGSSLFPSCLLASKKILSVSEERNRALRDLTIEETDRLPSFSFILFFSLFNWGIFVGQHMKLRLEDGVKRVTETPEKKWIVG